jgi:hypothetical protein
MKFLNECKAVLDKLDDFSFQIIKREINDYKKQISTVEDNKSHDQVFAFQQRVLGELPYFVLPKSETLIKNKVLSLINIHEQKFQLFDSMFNFMANIDTPKFNFERIWINAQRQGEFIPLHQHSGLYSFVIWVQMPFHINHFNPMLVKDRTALFEFVFVNSLGKLENYRIPVDKSYEGYIAVFPAELNHQVYPFYGSDDLRISISGNIRLAKESFL